MLAEDHQIFKPGWPPFLTVPCGCIKLPQDEGLSQGIGSCVKIL